MASKPTTTTTTSKKYSYAEHSVIAAFLAAKAVGGGGSQGAAAAPPGVKVLDKVLMPIGHALTLLGQGVEPAVMFIPLDKTEPMQLYDRTLRQQLGEFDRLAFGTFGFKVRAITNAVVHGHPVVLVLREPQKHGAEDFTISAYPCSNWAKEIHTVKITIPASSWEAPCECHQRRDLRETIFSIAMNNATSDQLLVAHDSLLRAFCLKTGHKQLQVPLYPSAQGCPGYPARSGISSMCFHEGTSQILVGWENASVQFLRADECNKVIGDTTLPVNYSLAPWWTQTVMVDGFMDKDTHFFMLHTSIAVHSSDPSHIDTFYAACGMGVWKVDAKNRTILAEYRTTPNVNVPPVDDRTCHSIAWLSRDMLVRTVCEVGEAMHKRGTEGGEAQVLKVWDMGSLPPGSGVQLPRLQPWSSESAAKAKSDARLARGSSTVGLEAAAAVAEASLASGYSLAAPFNSFCIVLPRPKHV